MATVTVAAALMSLLFAGSAAVAAAGAVNGTSVGASATIPKTGRPTMYEFTLPG